MATPTLEAMVIIRPVMGSVLEMADIWKGLDL